MVDAFYAVMSAFAFSTAVAVIYKGFLKYWGNIIVYQMMNHPITKISGENFTLNRFLYYKTDAPVRLVCSCNNTIV
jgi:hypothetical protein